MVYEIENHDVPTLLEVDAFSVGMPANIVRDMVLNRQRALDANTLEECLRVYVAIMS